MKGDTTLSFTHNTNFTDIGLSTGSNTTGIDQTRENLSDAYPNPVINNLTVDLGKLNENIVYVQIYTVSGIILMDQERSATDGKLKLEMGGLQPGVYILKVTVGNTIKALRFVKK